MATLFENLKKRLGDSNFAPKSKQSQISRVLKAGSGKAGPSTGARSTQIGEAGALQQAQTGVQQQAVTGQIAGEQLSTQSAGQESQTKLTEQKLASQGRLEKQDIASQAIRKQKELAAKEDMSTKTLESQQKQVVNKLNNAADMRMNELSSARGIEVDNIFSEFERSSKDLEDRKDAATLEQLGFTLAMRDKAYLDELNRIGRERSISDNIQYNTEKSRLILGENTNTLLEDINFQKGENIKQREFEKKMQQMSNEHVIQLNRAMVKDESDRLMWEAGANAVSAGAQYGIKKYNSSSSAPSKSSGNLTDFSASSEIQDS